MDSIFEYKDNFALYAHVKSKLILGGDFFEDAVVSIMIPTYKRPELLRETIESALKQSYDKNYHVIVVDNDDSGESWNAVEAVIESFYAPNLYLFRNEQNIGMFGNWNRCIELSPTDKFTVLHDDDLLKVAYLSNVMSLENPAKSLIGVQVSWFGVMPTKYTFSKLFEFLSFRKTNSITFNDAIFKNPFSGTLGVLFSKSKAIELGGFNPDFFPISDYVFILQYLRDSGGVDLNIMLADYRWQQNESNNPKTILANVDKLHQMRTELLTNKWHSGFSIFLEKKYYRSDIFWKRCRFSHAFQDNCPKLTILKSAFLRFFFVLIWFFYTKISLRP